MNKLKPFLGKLKQKYLYTLSGFALAVGLFFIMTNVYFVQEKNLPVLSGSDFQRITTPTIPENLDFAGERVPKESFDIFERIEREFIVNTYLHSFTMLSIKRAARWFPVIEPILKRNNIPDDFKYLAVIESGLYNAVSPVGATGFWQIMEDIGKKYQLEINSEVDERYNIEKSTEAACSYLKDAYGLFKNWTLAAASYNMGINGVEKQLDRQKTDNYYNLLLNEETSRYMARVIAMKEILKNPEKYGYFIKDNEKYLPLKSKAVEITGKIENLTAFATKNGINYKILKIYNPWLRDIELVNKDHRTYTIKIPAKGSIEPIK
jgi:transposase